MQDLEPTTEDSTEVFSRRLSTLAPMNLDGVQPPRRPTPERGEHTAEVLAEFGIDAAGLAALKAKGAV